MLTVIAKSTNVDTKECRTAELLAPISGRSCRIGALWTKLKTVVLESFIGQSRLVGRTPLHEMSSTCGARLS